MLTGIHFLLTYECLFKCDHCFLFSQPGAKGTFSLARLKTVLHQAKDLGSVTSIYFEGGEPFLYYPLMIAAMQYARRLGFDIGIVTNAYWAVSGEDARLWLEPLQDLGISDLSISDDSFHYSDQKISPAKRAITAARKMGLPVRSICIDPPEVQDNPKTGDDSRKGRPVVGGGAKFKGRAVETLVEGLPTRPFKELISCPHEELERPGRVHLDSYGNVMLCQGVVMGNCFEKPLPDLIKAYAPQEHPICGPLLRGGPAGLVTEYGLDLKRDAVDECHLCYLARLALIDRFSKHLGPPQVYGLD
jgi:hypothetical protein